MIAGEETEEEDDDNGDCDGDCVGDGADDIDIISVIFLIDNGMRVW
jgi:hypothetical protein